MNKLHIRQLANQYNLPETVVEAILKSPYEFIRNNTHNIVKDILKVPKFISK